MEHLTLFGIVAVIVTVSLALFGAKKVHDQQSKNAEKYEKIKSEHEKRNKSKTRLVTSARR